MAGNVFLNHALNSFSTSHGCFLVMAVLSHGLVPEVLEELSQAFVPEELEVLSHGLLPELLAVLSHGLVPEELAVVSHGKDILLLVSCRRLPYIGRLPSLTT